MRNQSHWWTWACRRAICIPTHCIRIQRMLEYSKFTWRADAIYEIWSYLYYSLCIANTLIESIFMHVSSISCINFTPYIKAENILIWVIVFQFKAPLIIMMSCVKDIWKSTAATKTKYYNGKSFFSPLSQTKWTWNLIACACPHHCLKYNSHIKGTLPNIPFINVQCTNFIWQNFRN